MKEGVGNRGACMRVFCHLIVAPWPARQASFCIT